MLLRQKIYPVAWCLALFGLCLLSGANGSHADILPPWMKSLDELRINTASADEDWAFASWYLDRQNDPEVQQSSGFSILPDIIFDLAYPYLNPENDDPEKAIILAERIGIRALDAKEIVLADLKYSTHGIAPNAQRYQQALRKTAFYLLEFGGGGPFFSFSREEAETLGLNELKLLMTDQYIENKRLHLGSKSSTNVITQDRHALRALELAVQEIPGTRRYVKETPPCRLLEESLSYWNGDAVLGVDKEFAEILFHTANHHEDIGSGGPDFDYWHGRMLTDFKILPGSEELSWLLMDVASALGHPDASLRLGRRAISQGDLKKAQQYMAIAAHHGIEEAKESLENLRLDHGNLLSEDEERDAMFTSEQYEVERCASLSSFHN